MLYINPTLPADQYIVRCYNGLTNSPTGNCGFTMTRVEVGGYRIDFGAGFNLDNRFFSLTTVGVGGGNVAPFGTAAFIYTWEPADNDGGFRFIDDTLYLIVY